MASSKSSEEHGLEEKFGRTWPRREVGKNLARTSSWEELGFKDKLGRTRLGRVLGRTWLRGEV